MPRADAVENRARLVAAALMALEREGASFSLNAVAKEAGVGIGTLYRHFPTRETLLVELYRNERDQLVASADELLATTAPEEALRAWCEKLTDQGRRKVGFGDALAQLASHDQLVAESYKPIIGALTRLLAANEKARTVRSGVQPDDVLLILSAVWRVPPTPEGDARATRMLGLILDGLARA